jgi:phosphoglycolate phosphatase-like HAD superfamily hydrolase
MFDVDGTLTQSYEYDRELFEIAIKAVIGCESVDTEWANYAHATSAGIASEAVLRTRGRVARKEEREEIERKYLSCLEERYQSNPAEFQEIRGAASLIAELTARGDLALSIATGCWLDEALFKLKASGLDVDGIPIASSSEEVSRESIMLLSEHKARLKNNMERFDSVLHIGDGIWDFKTARERGYGFIGVGGRLEQLKKAGAKYLHEDYSEKESFLRNIDRLIGA